MQYCLSFPIETQDTYSDLLLTDLLQTQYFLACIVFFLHTSDGQAVETKGEQQQGKKA